MGLIDRPDKETMQRILSGGNVPVIDRRRTSRFTTDLPADYDGPGMIIPFDRGTQNIPHITADLPNDYEGMTYLIALRTTMVQKQRYQYPRQEMINFVRRWFPRYESDEYFRIIAVGDLDYYMDLLAKNKQDFFNDSTVAGWIVGAPIPSDWTIPPESGNLEIFMPPKHSIVGIWDWSSYDRVIPTGASRGGVMPLDTGPPVG